MKSWMTLFEQAVGGSMDNDISLTRVSPSIKKYTIVNVAGVIEIKEENYEYRSGANSPQGEITVCSSRESGFKGKLRDVEEDAAKVKLYIAWHSN